MMGNKEGCFFSWSEAFLTGAETVGGKGWNLARLDRYGFAIPRGGVLSASVYGNFLEANGLREVCCLIEKAIGDTTATEQERL